jgi:ubiquinone/menaquinone biosynthesis C-methylase UbiE
MRSPTRLFYERFWHRPEESSPEDDRTTPARLKRLLAVLKDQSTSGRVLDAGCGNGFFTNAIKDAGYDVTGLDISENILIETRRRYPTAKLVLSGLDSPWPFEDKSFDMVFSTETIEHIFDIYEMIREANRTLKKNGTFMVTTPYHGLVKNLIICLFNFERHFSYVEGGHIRFFTKRSLRNLLQRFGFQVTKTACMGRIWPVSRIIFVQAVKVRDVR